MFGLPPELAHAAALRGLDLLRQTGLLRRRPAAGAPLRTMGIEFPNRLGLAAGMDKNAAYLRALDALGFGFIEVGTITPRPQRGNPRPRVFRLPRAEALINRMGFPNDGVQAAAANIKRAGRLTAVIGASIGRGAEARRTVDDYLFCLERLADCAGYFAINISSPNTAGLRDLHRPDKLRDLLSQLVARRDDLGGGRLALKISPDLADDEIAAVAKTAADCGIDGIIAVNTTVARPPQIAGMRHGGEAGGLSGRPLAARADAAIKILRRNLPRHTAIIGVGGIMSGADAKAKRAAGADLLQTYTGLVYRGPRLIKEILRTLSEPAE